MNFYQNFKTFNIYHKRYVLYISMTAIMYIFVVGEIKLFDIKFKTLQ